jgi:tetratricopeptide (TPR) repeat protein/DNA-binding PadR family transcriptional regulator
MYERKRLLPLRDAIILHLEPLSSRANPYVMPDSTCQEAMSDRLSASRGNLSRVMNDLKNDGYLEETRAHVPIGKLRRKTYVLTEVGMREARYLRGLTRHKEVRYRNEKSEMMKVRLGDIPKDIRDGSSLLDVALNVHRGVFDKVSYIDGQRKKAPFVSIESQRPRVFYFFGRQKELKTIEKWLGSKKARILEVKGVAGIGKTALVATAFKQFKEKTNTIWLNLDEHTTIETILDEFAAFFRLMGKEELHRYLKSQERTRIEGRMDAAVDDRRKGDMKSEDEKERAEVLYVLDESLNELDAVVVMDGCERIDDDLAGFIGNLFRGFQSRGGAKLVLAGREMTKFPELADLKKRGIASAMSLDVLDSESSRKILQLKGVETWRLEEAIEQSGGLPAFLDLMGPESESMANNIEAYLEEEVLGQLDRNEVRVLRIISVFDTPVHSDAFFQWKSMRFEAIRSLVERSLLMEVSPMVYATHDIVRELLKDRLSRKTKKDYHKRAAAYYLELGDIEDILRGSSHLIEAGQLDEAVKHMIESGRSMIAKGYHREVYQLLQKLDKVKKFSRVSELAFLKAECLNIQGAWDNAINEYNNSLLFGEDEEDLSIISISLRKISEIQMWRGSLDNVRESLERSAKIAENVKDLEGLASSYYDISTLLRMESDFEASEKYVDKCLKAAKKSGSKTEIARAYRAMGIVKGFVGTKAESIKARKLAVDFAEESDDLALLSSCYGSLALEYYYDKQFDEALDLDHKAVDSARNSGNASAVAWSLSNMASTLLSREEYDTASGCIDEAIEIYQRLQEHRLLAQVYIQCGYIYEDKDWGKAKKFLNKGLDLIIEFGNLPRVCEYYITVGAFYRWRGEEKEGLTYIDKARDLLAKIEDPKLKEKLESKIQAALTDTPKGQ